MILLLTSSVSTYTSKREPSTHQSSSSFLSRTHPHSNLGWGARCLILSNLIYRTASWFHKQTWSLIFPAVSWVVYCNTISEPTGRDSWYLSHKIRILHVQLFFFFFFFFILFLFFFLLHDACHREHPCYLPCTVTNMYGNYICDIRIVNILTFRCLNSKIESPFVFNFEITL